MDAPEFLEQLEKEIESHEAVHYPFLRRFSTEPHSQDLQSTPPETFYNPQGSEQSERRSDKITQGQKGIMGWPGESRV